MYYGGGVGRLARARGGELTRLVSDEGFGRMTYPRVPGGGEPGLYEPRHPTPR